MKLTREQIEAARERLQTLVEYFCQAVEMEEGAKAAAFDDIDALCAAASEPESLVGRRVRVPYLGLSGCISAKLNPQWQVDFDDGGMDTFFRDDFELLEDDNACPG